MFAKPFPACNGRFDAVVVSASVVVDRPIEVVFDYTTDHGNYRRFLRRVGPIEAVVDATISGVGIPQVGARRRVTTGDGAVFDEVVVSHARPAVHAYYWVGDAKRPFSLLAVAGSARWRYRETAEGTHIDWSYRFALTSPWVYPLAKLVASGPFRRWMRIGLGRAAEQLLSGTTIVGTSAPDNSPSTEGRVSEADPSSSTVAAGVG